MKLNRIACRRMFALPIVLVTVIASTSWAVPYASGVSQSGNEVSFILNQDAYRQGSVLVAGPSFQPSQRRTGASQKRAESQWPGNQSG